MSPRVPAAVAADVRTLLRLLELRSHEPRDARLFDKVKGNVRRHFRALPARRVR